MTAVTAVTGLRDYQQHAVDSARVLVKEGVRRFILQAPTGAGKSIIIREIIARLCQRGRRATFVAPRAEIIEQLSRHLDAVDIDHGVLQGSHWRTRPWLPVQVATPTTLLRRETTPPDVLFLDEAHLHLDAAKKLIARFPQALVIGTTATPARLDGRGLGEVYQRIVPVVGVRELIATGHLVPFRVFAPEVPDLAGVRTTAGDFNRKDLRQVMDRPAVVGDVVATWLRLARGRGTIVFAVSVEASQRLAAAFREAGVSAAHVDAETAPVERKRVADELRSGALDVACNVELFTYGLDVPRVSCVSIARPTQSLALHLQMLGRGLRPAMGKEDLVILDHSSNVLMHGFPDEERSWALAGISRRPKGDDIAPGLRPPCPRCFAVMPSTADVCAGVIEGVPCGYFFPKRPRIVLERPGEIREVTLKSRAALMGPDQRAGALAKWIRAGRENGYKAGRAYVIYRGTFGVPVDPITEARALELAGERRSA